MQRVAAQLGYGTESVRPWVRQADIDAGHLVGVSTGEAAKLKALERICSVCGGRRWDAPIYYARWGRAARQECAPGPA